MNQIRIQNGSGSNFMSSDESRRAFINKFTSKDRFDNDTKEKSKFPRKERLDNDIIEKSKILYNNKFKDENHQLQKFLKTIISKNILNKDNIIQINNDIRRKSMINTKIKKNDPHNFLSEDIPFHRKTFMSNKGLIFKPSIEESKKLSPKIKKPRNSILNEIDHKNNFHEYLSLNDNKIIRSGLIGNPSVSKDSIKSNRIKYNNSKREVNQNCDILSILSEQISKKIEDDKFSSNIINLEIKPEINLEKFNEFDKKIGKNLERQLVKIENIKDSISDSEETMIFNEEAYIAFSYLIYPDSNFKMYWNYLILLIVIYSSTFSPYRIAFNYHDDLWSLYFTIDFIFDIIFIIDILINFIVPFYDDDENLVVAFSHIATNYINSWLLYDSISSIPITIIELCGNNLNQSSKYNINKVIKIIRILKWLRLTRIIKLAKHFYSQIIPNSSCLISKIIFDQGVFIRLFKSGIIFLFLIHLTSCLWVYIGQIDEYYTTSWVSTSDLEELEDHEIYIASLYFSLTTIYSIGYGDILSSNVIERAYNCFFMVIGVMVFSFAISSLSTMFLSTDKTTKKYEYSVLVLDDLKYQYSLKNEIYEKIKSSLRFQYIKNYSDKYSLLSSLPRNLKNEIIIILHKQKIKELNFFKNKPYDFILYLLPLLFSIKLLKREFVFCLGDFVEEMYLCVEGCLSLHLGYMFHNTEVALIKKNLSFGDILMYSNEQSPFDLKVKSKDCELLVLKKLEYSKLKMKFPDIVTADLKKSLEEYKFIMERRKVAIQSILNSEKKYPNNIVSKMKKVRLPKKTKDPVISSTINKKVKKKRVLSLNDNHKSNGGTFPVDKSSINHKGSIEIMEKGINDEMDLDVMIKEENKKNKFNLSKQIEKLKYRHQETPDVELKNNLTELFIENNPSFVKVPKIDLNKKKIQVRRKHSISSGIQFKRLSKININYYQIENNVDKFFYLNDEDKLNCSKHSIKSSVYINDLYKKTTKRLKTIIEKKSNKLKKLSKKQSQVNSLDSRESEGNRNYYQKKVNDKLDILLKLLKESVDYSKCK